MSPLRLAALLLTFAAIAAPARAQTDAAPAVEVPPSSDVWTFRAVPYLWVAGLEGSAGTADDGGNDGVSIKTDTTTEWGLNFAGMLALEARHGPFAIGFDGNYLDLDGDGTLRGDRGNLQVDCDLRLQAGIMAFPVSYRFLQLEHLKLDGYAGLRLYIVYVDIDAHGSFRNRLESEVHDDATKSWADPIVGARIGVPVTEWLEVGISGDIGGFGAGSDLSWLAQGGVRFIFTDALGMTVGYRAMGVEFTDELDLSLILLGPFATFEVRF